MDVGLCTAEGFCEAEINDMNDILSRTSSKQDIIRFDITMDEMSRVNVFKKSYLCNK